MAVLYWAVLGPPGVEGVLGRELFHLGARSALRLRWFWSPLGGNSRERQRPTDHKVLVVLLVFMAV